MDEYARQVASQQLYTGTRFATAFCESEQPRTLDALSNIVARLKTDRRQLDAMLDRVAPHPEKPCEAADNSSALQIRKVPYGESIKDIDIELDCIASLIDQLERHV